MKKTIYYIGSIYLPELNHAQFGNFKINPDDGSVEVPVPYADRLVQHSPKLFTDVAPKKVQKVAGSDYADQPWASLKKLAAARGINTGGMNKVQVVDALLRQDASGDIPDGSEQVQES